MPGLQDVFQLKWYIAQLYKVDASLPNTQDFERELASALEALETQHEKLQVAMTMGRELRPELHNPNIEGPDADDLFLTQTSFESCGRLFQKLIEITNEPSRRRQPTSLAAYNTACERWMAIHEHGALAYLACGGEIAYDHVVLEMEYQDLGRLHWQAHLNRPDSPLFTRLAMEYSAIRLHAPDDPQLSAAADAFRISCANLGKLRDLERLQKFLSEEQSEGLALYFSTKWTTVN